MNLIPLSPISSFLKPLRCAQSFSKEPETQSANIETQTLNASRPRIVTVDQSLKELNDHQYTKFLNTKNLNENDLHRHRMHQRQRQIVGQCRPIIKRRNNYQTFHITVKHVRQMTKVKDLPFNVINCSPDFSFLKQRLNMIELFRQAFNMTQLELSQLLKMKYRVDVSQAQISQLEKQNVSISLAKVLLHRMEPWFDYCKSMGLSHQSFVCRPPRPIIGSRQELSPAKVELLSDLFKLDHSPSTDQLKALSDVTNVHIEYLRGWFFRRRRKLRCSDSGKLHARADPNLWIETLKIWKYPSEEGSSSGAIVLTKIIK